MHSITVYTDEIDDLELAAEELSQKIPADFKLYKNSVGIIYCDVETDEVELVKALRAYYDFPILGATAVALLTTNEGYNDVGIAFMIMTCDDYEYAATITEELTLANVDAEISKAYNNLLGQITQKPQLALILAPQMEDVTGDFIVQSFNKACDNKLPLFGGIASDSFTMADNRIFFNEESSRRKVVLVMLAGDFQPIYQQHYTIIDTKDHMYTVTKSKDNVVYELEQGRFLDVLRSTGMDVNEVDAYLKFVGTVFEANITMPNGETISVMRDIHTINFEDGSAIMLGNVPVGSKMRLCMLTKENITRSVKQAFDDVLAQIKAHPEHQYTTILCASCAGRFLNLSSEPDAEGKAYQGLLPQGISLAGMYSFGEIYPTLMQDGSSFNIFHNKTFTLVAF